MEIEVVWDYDGGWVEYEPAHWVDLTVTTRTIPCSLFAEYVRAQNRVKDIGDDIAKYPKAHRAPTRG